MPDRMNVLFIQAQESFGADAAVHAHLMRALDRRDFRVHVACTKGTGTAAPPALVELSKLPDVELKEIRFAPTLGRKTPEELWRALRSSIGFQRDVLELRNYIVRERIALIHGSDRPRSALYTVALAKLAGIKSVVHVHVRWSSDYGKLPSLAVARADAAFGISRYVSDSIV